MRSQIVSTLIQFILASASKNDWPDCELGDIHIIKYLYLADLSHAYRHNGETLTGINWKFYHFGPYAYEAVASIEPALMAFDAEKKLLPSTISDDYHRWVCSHGCREIQKDARIDPLSFIDIQGLVKKYGSDTKALLHYTYTTEPMLTAAPNELLCFPKERKMAIAPVKREEVQKTFKQQKKEKEKVAEVKAVFQEKLRKRLEVQDKERAKAFKAPRYDEVFFAGVNALEELAGEKLDQRDLVCEFSESFWKSKARHDPDLS